MDFTLLDTLRLEYPDYPVFFEYPADVYVYKLVAEYMRCWVSDYAKIDGVLRVNSKDPNTAYAMNKELHHTNYLAWEECETIVAGKIRNAEWQPCILVSLS